MSVTEKNTLLITQNYTEFVDYVYNTKPINGDHARTGSGKWYGGTFEEAYKLATEGWDAGVKELKINEPRQQEFQMEVIAQPAGNFVNIPSYLNGQPDNMFAFENNVVYNQKKVTLFVQLNYGASNGVEEAMKYTSNIINVVNELNQDYKIKVVGVFASNGFGGRFVSGDKKGQKVPYQNVINEVIIKDYDDKFVLNNLAFGFHPAFYRRFRFGYLETLDWNTAQHYGCVMDYDTTVNFLKHRYLKDGNKVLCCPHITRGKFSIKDFKEVTEKTFRM